MVGRYSRRFFTSTRHAGPEREHFDGRKFRNLEPTDRWAREVFRWLLTRQPQAWPKSVPSSDVEMPPVAPRSDKLKVTFVNHSTVLVQVAGLNFLTDPVWSPRVGPFPWLGARRVRSPGIRFDALPRIDCVLLSHDHYDHLDMVTLKRLMLRDQPTVLCGLGVDKTLAIDGVQGAVAMDWWEEHDLANGTKVVFTPSQHFSGRGLFDQDSTLWGSFVVESPQGRFYFAGDTGYGPHFRQVRERLGAVDCALLPVGAYEPRWFMRAYHMAPEDSVVAHQELGARVSVGIHHSTFHLGDEGIERPAQDLATALAEAGVPEESFLMLKFGGSVDVDQVATWGCTATGSFGKD